jgi:hypothetical protein
MVLEFLGSLLGEITCLGCVCSEVNDIFQIFDWSVLAVFSDMSFPVFAGAALVV